VTQKYEDQELKVQSIFHSIDGEDNGFLNAGQLSTFIRLAGCNLKCSYCDTVYAQQVNANTEFMRIDKVIQSIRYDKITITGGEPLLQAVPLRHLLVCLDGNARQCNKIMYITIETNGTISTNRLRSGMLTPHLFIRYVVDYKLAHSDVPDQMRGRDTIYDELSSKDVIKFPIACPDDYEEAKEVVIRHPGWKARKVFSPVIGSSFIEEWKTELAERMIEERSPLLHSVKYSLQLHKVLWPNAKPEEEH